MLENIASIEYANVMQWYHYIYQVAVASHNRAQRLWSHVHMYVGPRGLIY